MDGFYVTLMGFNLQQPYELMKNISIIKYILLILMIGVAIGLVVYLLKLLLESFTISLPTGALGGAVTGAGLVFAMVIINKSIKNGGFKWLQKKKSDIS